MAIEDKQKFIRELLRKGEVKLTISEISELGGFSRAHIVSLVNEKNPDAFPPQGKRSTNKGQNPMEYLVTPNTLRLIDKNRVLEILFRKAQHGLLEEGIEEEIGNIEPENADKTVFQPANPVTPEYAQPKTQQHIPAPAAQPKPQSAQPASRELYTLDYAVRKLRQKNPFYTTEMITNILPVVRAVKASDLEDLIQYMQGKRFFEQIDSVVLEKITREANSSRQNKLSLDDVMEQIKRGTVAEGRGYKVVTMSDDEIVEMMHNGLWLDPHQIKALGSGLRKEEITVMLLDKPSVFMTKTYEGISIAYVTYDNMPHLKLETKVEIDVGGKHETIHPGRTYDSGYISKLFKQMHGVFNDANTRLIYEKTEGIGSELIKILRQVEGGIIVPISTSAKQRLASDLGIDWKELEAILNSNACKKYWHTIEGIVNEPYLLKRELGDLKKTVMKVKATGNYNLDSSGDNDATGEYETAKAFEKYRVILKDKGILPEGRLYERLVELGILDESSVKRINESYTAFLEKMDGFEYFNIDKLVSELGIGWDQLRKAFGMLAKESLIRNLQPLPGSDNDFYVAARGKKYDIKKRMKSILHLQ